MGASLTFNGTTSEVDCGTGSSITDIFNGGGTYITWFNANNDGEANFGRLFSKGNSNAGVECYVVEISTTPRIDVRGGYSSNVGSWYTDDTISYNTWQYVWVTYDVSLDTNVPSIYINGSLSTIQEPITPNGTYGSDSALSMILGNRSANDRTFDGEIAYSQFWDRVLSVDEMIEATYKPGSIPLNLVGYWPLIESSTSAPDLSGNGNTGTITDGTLSNDGPAIRSF